MTLANKLTSERAMRVFAPALRTLAGLEDRALANMAAEYVTRLVRAADGPDVSGSAYATVDDEGNISVEWFMPEHRIGMCFCKKSDDSGWWFCSSMKAGSRLGCGELDTFDAERLVKFAADYRSEPEGRS